LSDFIDISKPHSLLSTAKARRRKEDPQRNPETCTKFDPATIAPTVENPGDST
jgi:hypothetical protein